jgi:SAM-dependent methyltransferase
MINEHDRELAEAFDVQAARFERAPVQSDPAALERLVREARLAAGCRVLDAGCGPGLVSEALLQAGHRVVGVDLSREMVDRALARCVRFADRAEFHQISVFDSTLDSLGPFDAALSRYVLHHVLDPRVFLERQVELLGSGGILVVSDHVTDPDSDRAQHHEGLERARDRTHTRNLTGGQIVDLCAGVGLVELRLTEESFTLDFDEWFDRGTPLESKEQVRSRLLSGPAVRGFRPHLQSDGSLLIECIRAIVRGVKPRVDPPRT